MIKIISISRVNNQQVVGELATAEDANDTLEFEYDGTGVHTDEDRQFVLDIVNVMKD